jgi:hypothetical protein
VLVGSFSAVVGESGYTTAFIPIFNLDLLARPDLVLTILYNSLVPGSVLYVDDFELLLDLEQEL